MNFRSASGRPKIEIFGSEGRLKAKVRASLGRVGGQGGVRKRLWSLQISDTRSDTPCNPALRDGGGGSECA